MRDYRIKISRWIQWLYPTRTWRIPKQEKTLYLTFDDGPHPTITPFVLDQLDRYGAKAHFFCIGDNVQRYLDTYRRIIEKGHGVGNHTQHHLNGWKTTDVTYLADVTMARQFIESDWFRPPYGRIRSRQVRLLKNQFPQTRIAMWDVLSGDFDKTRSGEWCANQVLRSASPGSIIVFHDSEKAWDRLQVCLPIILEKFNELGYRFEILPGN
ncbi:MAG: polysaccharide deacetylase family protein [Bacteroidota bacterium]